MCDYCLSEEELNSYEKTDFNVDGYGTYTVCTECIYHKDKDKKFDSEDYFKVHTGYRFFCKARDEWRLYPFKFKKDEDDEREWIEIDEDKVVKRWQEIGYDRFIDLCNEQCDDYDKVSRLIYYFNEKVCYELTIGDIDMDYIKGNILMVPNKKFFQLLLNQANDRIKVIKEKYKEDLKNAENHKKHIEKLLKKD